MDLLDSSQKWRSAVWPPLPLDSMKVAGCELDHRRSSPEGHLRELLEREHGLSGVGVGLP